MEEARFSNTSAGGLGSESRSIKERAEGAMRKGGPGAGSNEERNSWLGKGEFVVIRRKR